MTYRKLAAPSSFLLLAALAVPSAQAAESKADGQWRGSGVAALAATSGNTNSSTALVKADMSVATLRDKISLGGSLNYGRSKQNGVSSTTDNRWDAFGQYDYNLNPKVYLFGRLGLESDRIAKLDLRNTAAGGAGYKLIDTEDTTFNVFGGAAYSSDKYSQAQTVRGDTGTRFSRTSVLLGEESNHKLSEVVSFKQRLEVYSGVSGDKAQLAKFSALFSVAMNSKISLSVGLTDSYNSRPPIGQKKNDAALFTGINVKLGAL